MPRHRHSTRALALVLGGLIAVPVAVELVLAGADHGLWGIPSWRIRAYDLGAFQPWLLFGVAPSFSGQPFWMFLSHAALHGGLLHLVGNMLSLAVLGLAVGRRFGAAALMGIYLGAVVAGAASFALLSPGLGLMIGASGGVFGLAGALAPRRPAAFWQLVAWLAAMNLGLWALSGGLLAWQAHLGGFLAGLCLGPGKLLHRR